MNFVCMNFLKSFVPKKYLKKINSQSNMLFKITPKLVLLIKAIVSDYDKKKQKMTSISKFSSNVASFF